ncbi:MAG: nitroreductase family protein [Terracidiphilus sp.]|jgi:nitroreductase
MAKPELLWLCSEWGEQDMNVKEAIQTRRSVWNYQPKAVEPEKLQALIEAVRLAPSATDTQPWKLILVDDPAIREQVARTTFSKTVSFNEYSLEAPVLAVLAIEPDTIVTQIGGWLKKHPFSLIDIGIAAAHFCLQATDLGLGTCIMGWFNESAIKKILHVPRATRIGVVIALGYGVEPPGLYPKTRKAASEMSSRNHY